MNYSMNNASNEQCLGTLSWSLVQNLTSSYTNRRNEGTTVATSVVMFVLAAVFFILNLFSRFSDVSAILNPSVRLFLSTSLSLFLPVMSYLFSEAKNEDNQKAELPVRARMILMWMLLVELLRKKVEAILVSAGVQGYSGTIERAARIGWLGYLVFYNLKSVGNKAFYGILWVLAAAKLVQRFVTLELGKRSFAYGKNPQLLASYMAKMLQHDGDTGLLGPELLKRCDYVVMGEEDLEKKAGPEGYELELAEATADADSGVVTVGKIWKLAETDELLRKDPKLKRLCLSFALYKLLRRRLEDFPIAAAEARNCRDLIFNGLCKEGATDEDDATAVALFDVFNDEVQFLCEYYHSVQPVVLASPYFFLVNYILFPVVVWAFCLVTIILCSHGDVLYAFRSFNVDADNYAVWLMAGAGCVLKRVLGSSPQYIYSIVDIAITILLLLAFAYEEVWEFVVFLISNWFMVSLLCSYVSKPRWRRSPFLSGVIRRILWVRGVLSHTNVRFKQFSVLRLCRISWCLPTKAVPVEAKKAILERLVKIAGGDAAAPSNAWLKSQECLQLIYPDERLLTFDRAGVAEVILIWHIATDMLVARHPLPKQAKPGAVVATAVSGYCAYLVAFHPELLPDDRDGTEHVYKELKKELKKEMGCFWYYCSPPWQRHSKLMEIAGRPQAAAAVVVPWTALRKGSRLGKHLIDKYEAAGTDEAARESVWELVAGVWTEVVAYAAPASGELHVKAHREALAQGGEFITVLWAIATHAGIARPAAPACTV